VGRTRPEAEEVSIASLSEMKVTPRPPAGGQKQSLSDP